MLADHMHIQDEERDVPDLLFAEQRSENVGAHGVQRVHAEREAEAGMAVVLCPFVATAVVAVILQEAV